MKRIAVLLLALTLTLSIETGILYYDTYYASILSKVILFLGFLFDCIILWQGIEYAISPTKKKEIQEERDYEDFSYTR